MMALRSQKKVETQGFRIGMTLLKALFPEALHPSARPRPSRAIEAPSRSGAHRALCRAGMAFWPRHGKDVSHEVIDF